MDPVDFLSLFPATLATREERIEKLRSLSAADLLRQPTALRLINFLVYSHWHREQEALLTEQLRKLNKLQANLRRNARLLSESEAQQ